jgi:CRP-like cAMP-binding protein
MDQIRLFFSRLTDIDDASWNLFKASLETWRFERKSQVLAPGQICDFVGFVESGVFRFYYLKDGGEKVTAFFFPDEFLSNYRSFLTGQPSGHFIECLQEGTVWVVRKSDLERLFETNATIHKIGRLMAERLYLMVASRLDSFLYDTPEERYLALLDKGSRLVQAIPQYMLASYLGVSAETLSRIRKRIMT